MKEKIERFLKKYNKKNKIIIKGGAITVEGSLNLSNTNITKLPEGLTVGGSLDLSNTNITKLPEGLTVGGSLDLRNTNITKLPERLTVGGGLDLRNTNITKLPEGLTVGDWLDLRNTNITKLPEGLTVGGSLNLSNTNITKLPDNLMINSTLYGFNGDRTTSIKKVLKGYNEELRYIYFDGILWGNVKSVKKAKNITIYKTPLGYCVVEKELSAHGKTLKEAMEDLTFKKLRNTDNSEIIKEIKKTSKVNRVQYRAITGACQMGTERFCQQHNITADEISLEELRKILVNDYGAEKFWNLIDREE